MKLRVLSDLHIEFHPYSIPTMKDDEHTVLILAGDIGVIRHRVELESFLRAAAKQFHAVVYVLGNHEYYGGIWPEAKNQLLKWNLPDNLHVLDRQWVQIHDIIFVGTTLWTDFDKEDAAVMHEADQILNDFYEVYARDEHDQDLSRLRPQQVLDEHKDSLRWLNATLNRFQKQGKRCVVVTHHGVSPLSVHDSYRDNSLNGAFVSDCSELFERTKPELVVHGHVHNSFDYLLGASATRVVVNPRGYTRSDETQENPLFDPFLTIDLGV